jgi:poly(beta-D-mannuronate) lyase
MRHASLLGALLTLVIVPAVVAAQSASQSVWGPFDPAARHALAAHLPAPTAATSVCGLPPAPVVHLGMEGFYADPSSSIVDERKMAAYRDAVKPIELFETGIARASDRFVRTGDQDGARCALAWMVRWADAGAMLDAGTSQGGYVRKWGLAAVAAATLKIRAADVNPVALSRVREWIRRWAGLVRDEYEARPTLSSHRNNHLYWAAWSVGLAAAGLDDRALLDWSIVKLRVGIDQIDERGFLPLEVARKGRTLHYHVFAVAPLVLGAELAAANGIDLYAYRDGALHRLVETIVAGLGNPAPFAETAGVTQETKGLISGGDLGWLEAYVARFPDLPASTAAAQYLTRVRPAFHRWYGGDATLLYGVESLP